MLNVDFVNILQTNGFFVECGAFDGLTYSNTFYLERQLQWSGLMIEAGPINFKLALEKNRNVSLVPACLSLTTKPKVVNFPFAHYAGFKINENASLSTVKVQCLPFYSILLAMNRTTIDLFSLDIEGNELDVLRTIPFDKVNIKV
jgi:Methyltransferase FkbM domain